jgi:hypothetical protein
MHVQITTRARCVALGLVAVGALACGCGPAAGDAGSEELPESETSDIRPADVPESAVSELPPGDAPPSDTAGTGTDAGLLGPPQVGGAEALGTPRITSLDEAANWIQMSTGSCADARELDEGVRNTLERYWYDTAGPEELQELQPFLADFSALVAGVGRCTVNDPDGSLLDADFLVFDDGAFPEAQRVWKDHSSDGPPDDRVMFGNGFAVRGIEDHPDTVARLVVMYLRCGDDGSLGGQQMPADVDGCRFTTVR